MHDTALELPDLKGKPADFSLIVYDDAKAAPAADYGKTPDVIPVKPDDSNRQGEPITYCDFIPDPRGSLVTG